MPVIDDISIQVTDAKGAARRSHVYLQTGGTLVEIQGFVDANAPLLDAIIEGLVTDISFTRTLVIPGGLKGAAIADSDVEEGANMLFDVAATPYAHGIRLPTILQTLLTGYEVDIADLDVIAWGNSIINGTVGCVPSDRTGGDVVGLLSGKKSFRRK
jgi:hypothetical protein